MRLRRKRRGGHGREGASVAHSSTAIAILIIGLLKLRGVGVLCQCIQISLLSWMGIQIVEISSFQWYIFFPVSISKQMQRQSHGMSLTVQSRRPNIVLLLGYVWHKSTPHHHQSSTPVESSPDLTPRLWFHVHWSPWLEYEHDKSKLPLQIIIDNA